MNKRVRVLIADDQQPTRRGLKAILTYVPQIEVIGEVANGQEAVQFAEKHHPHVVLMDIQMPVLDGIRATQLIKSQWPNIKIIALTMYPAYRAEALKAGADVLLLKGCTAETLKTAILEAGDLDS